MKKINKNIIILILAASALIILCYACWDYIAGFYSLLADREKLKSYLESFGYWSWAVFFLFQVLQVVIFFIPGEVIQAAGGYVFGALWGTVISLLGIGVGSFILFVVSHKYGKAFVEKLVSKEFHKKVSNILNTKRQKLVVFLLYLLPGLPKDSLILVCGLTDMTPKTFIILSMTARIPALTMSCYFGANLASGNHGAAIALAVIAVIIVILGAIYKEEILKKLSRM